MEVVYQSPSENWVDLERLLISDGKKVTSRGLEYREIEDLKLVFKDPTRGYIDSPSRKNNLPFCIANFCDMILGTEYSLKVNPQLAKFVNEETGHQDGHYGKRMNLPKGSQLERVIGQLYKDMFTRQAVITLHNPLMENFDGKDIACTLSLQFLYRNNKLDLITTMRSNDSRLGFVSDVYGFTLLQRQVAAIMGVGVGEYHHNAGSMHIYDTDIPKTDLHDNENPYRNTSYGRASIMTESIGYLFSDYKIVMKMLDDIPLQYKFVVMQDISDPYAQECAKVMLAYHEWQNGDKSVAANIANKLQSEFRYYFERRGII